MIDCSPYLYTVDPAWPEAWRRPLYAAVQTWERVTGRDFVETDKGTVYITIADTEEMFGQYTQGARWGAWIYLNEDLKPGKWLRKIITHELGHSLGANHTPDESSIMNDDVTGNSITSIDLVSVARCNID